MIQENWDQSVQNDVVTLLAGWFPPAFGNTISRTTTAMRHLKAGLDRCIGNNTHN